MTALSSPYGSSKIQLGDSAIARAFERRVERTRNSGMAVCAMTIDPESLRYLDAALRDVVSRTDGPALPSSLNPEMTMLRSAAVEVIAAAYVRVVETDVTRTPHTDAPAVDQFSALLNGRVNVMPGILRRLSPEAKAQLETFDCLLPPEVLTELDQALRGAIHKTVDQTEQTLWQEDLFDDLRSAFVEAGMMAWLVWRSHAISRDVQGITRLCSGAPALFAPQRRGVQR